MRFCAITPESRRSLTSDDLKGTKGIHFGSEDTANGSVELKADSRPVSRCDRRVNASPRQAAKRVVEIS